MALSFGSTIISCARARTGIQSSNETRFAMASDEVIRNDKFDYVKFGRSDMIVSKVCATVES